jgi:hypothetical protein
LLVWLLILATVAARGADALILIRRDRAGPNLRMGAYIHPEWMLWPSAGAGGSADGLLSILSGKDWQGSEGDLQFSSGRQRTWRSLNWSELNKRGYCGEQALFVGEPVCLIADPRGSVGQAGLILGTTGRGPTVRARAFADQTPEGQLIVYEALAWDDARRLASRCGGRSLALEYPPAPGTSWSRFWRLGAGWPQSGSVPVVPDLNVEGLIPVRDALTLLRSPDRFNWVTDSSKRWGGANRWLARAQAASPAVGATIYALAVLAALVGLVRMANEQSSFLDRSMVGAVFMAVPADVVAGNLCRLIGLQWWTAALAASFLMLVAASSLTGAVIRVRHPNAHRLWGTWIVAALALSVLDPTWSDFSPVFRLPVRDLSPEIAAVWVGCITCALAFATDFGKRWIWIRRGAACCLSVSSCLWNPWWVAGNPSYVAASLVPLASAEGVCHGLFLVTLLFLPPSIVPLSYGLSWKPGGLILMASDETAFNTAAWADAVTSWGFMLFALLAGAAGLFGSGFVAYRIRRVVREDPRRSCLLWASLALLALGILNPVWLSASWMVAIGGVLLLQHDAVS